MRKALFIAALICLAVSFSSAAQTCCYKQVENVQNGVKSKGYGNCIYFTFQNDRNQFYESDANGYAAGGGTPRVYKLISANNGYYKYQLQGPYAPINIYYTFNSDFTRVNATSQYMPGYVGVYQLVDGPEESNEEFY